MEFMIRVLIVQAYLSNHLSAQDRRMNLNRLVLMLPWLQPRFLGQPGRISKIATKTVESSRALSVTGPNQPALTTLGTRGGPYKVLTSQQRPLSAENINLSLLSTHKLLPYNRR